MSILSSIEEDCKRHYWRFVVRVKSSANCGDWLI